MNVFPTRSPAVTDRGGTRPSVAGSGAVDRQASRRGAADRRAPRRETGRPDVAACDGEGRPDEAVPTLVRTSRHGRVVLATIERPEALNALNADVLEQLLAALVPLDDDPEVGCFVVTGSARAFAAGADIREMHGREHMDLFHADFLGGWDRFVRLRTPKVAAVAGHALGGGCELATMCDTIYASESARFGQPEVRLGLIPGMGGTQRLTRAVDKAKAMDMILSGRPIGAREAESAGLVARVFDDERFLDEALEAAAAIASFGRASTMLARECVDQAFESGLTAGLAFERRVYHSIFSTRDAREGVGAFLDKREPTFVGR